MKKLLLTAAAVIAVLTLVTLSACTTTESHTYGGWQYDDAKHWKDCTDCGSRGFEAPHDWHTGSVTPWLVLWECECGHTKTETDYTTMTIGQFFAEMTKNEGNFLIDSLFTIIGADLPFASGIYAVDGKRSYFCYTDFASANTSHTYKLLSESGPAAEFSSSDNISWDVTVRNIRDNTFNTWLSWDGWTFKSNDDLFVTEADYTYNGVLNRYEAVLRTSLSTITFYDYGVVMQGWGSAHTVTSLFTFGVAAVGEPPEIAELQNNHPFFMFGAVPDSFQNHDGDTIWRFERGEAFADEMLAALTAKGWTLDADYYEEHWGGDWGAGATEARLLSSGVMLIHCGTGSYESARFYELRLFYG